MSKMPHPYHGNLWQDRLLETRFPSTDLSVVPACSLKTATATTAAIKLSFKNRKGPSKAALTSMSNSSCRGFVLTPIFCQHGRGRNRNAITVPVVRYPVTLKILYQSVQASNVRKRAFNRSVAATTAHDNTQRAHRGNHACGVQLSKIVWSFPDLLCGDNSTQSLFHAEGRKL